MTRFFARPRGDEGASLIIALAFLALFGLFVSALLDYTGTSVRTTAVARDQGFGSYDADGGLQAALAAVKASSTAPSPSSCPTTTVPAPAGRPAVLVTCTAEQAPGSSNVPITSANKPGQAILTLSTNAGEQGFFMDANNQVRVRGAVISNTTITVAGSASLVTENAPIRARGACSGPITATPPHTVECNTGTITADPNYAQPAGPLVRRVAPACSAAVGGVITLEPGLYDDAVALSTLTGPGCTATFVFRPGTFYFDFTNVGSHMWSLNNPATLLVGGTPTWNTSTSRFPPVVSMNGSRSVYVPGACRSPLDLVANGGTRFVFGGDSQFSVLSGQAELCGPYSSSAPPVVLHGAKAQIGSASPVVAAGLSMTPGSGGSTGTGHTAFTNPNNIVPDDANATADTPALTARAVASVTVSGFEPATPIPPGATLVSAQLNVRHRNPPSQTSAGRISTVEVTITPAGGTAAAARSLAVNDGASLATQSVNVTSDLAAHVQANGWSGGSVSYRATENNQAGGRALLESVTLDLTYTLPYFRAQTGCVSTAPYVRGSSNCALLSSEGSQTYLYLQGTTYAPLAAVDIRVANTSGQVFRSGIISRVLQVALPAATPTEAVIQVPDDSTGVPPVDVYFRSYVCPQGSSCPTPPAGTEPGSPWKLAGTASAVYQDDPAAGSRSLEAVRTYNIRR